MLKSPRKDFHVALIENAVYYSTYELFLFTKTEAEPSPASAPLLRGTAILSLAQFIQSVLERQRSLVGTSYERKILPTRDRAKMAEALG